MNLEKASIHHRNLVLSFATCFVFAQAIGAKSGKDYGELTLLLSIIVISLFLWHSISAFFLGKNLEKNKFLWAVTGFMSPFLIFIPSAFLIVSANKAFKANNWKVKFYGGAVRQEEQSNA